MNGKRAERNLKIGLFGALLTLVGDLLIGAAKFPDGASMIDGYFAIALAMPTWRPILGGLIGFVGICLEFCGLMTVYPLDSTSSSITTLKQSRRSMAGSMGSTSKASC